MPRIRQPTGGAGHRSVPSCCYTRSGDRSILKACVVAAPLHAADAAANELQPLSPSARIAICVNPMAGRDVRRLAARATNVTHEAKRDMVARIAAGADAVGVRHIHVAREPFRIAAGALSLLPLAAKIHLVETPLRHDARDTEAAVRAFLEEGVTTIVTLGGDGTNRAVARIARDINLVPISVGTNNVFPSLVEPTTAGMVAGLNKAVVMM